MHMGASRMGASLSQQLAVNEGPPIFLAQAGALTWQGEEDPTPAEAGRIVRGHRHHHAGE